MPSWQKRQPGSDNRGGRGGNRGNFNQNRGNSQQGFPQSQYQQQPSHNPNFSGEGQYGNQGGQNQSRGRGSGRVQGGWNNDGQSYNQRGQRGRR